MLAKADRLAALAVQHRLPPDHPSGHAPVALVAARQRAQEVLGVFAIPRVVEARHVVDAFQRHAVVVDVHAPASAVLVLHPCGHVIAYGVLRRNVQDCEDAVLLAKSKQKVDLREVVDALRLFDAAPFAEAVEARVPQLPHLRDVRRPFRDVRPFRAAERRVHVPHNDPVCRNPHILCRCRRSAAQRHAAQGQSPNRFIHFHLHSPLQSRSCARATCTGLGSSPFDQSCD